MFALAACLILKFSPKNISVHSESVIPEKLLAAVICYTWRRVQWILLHFIRNDLERYYWVSISWLCEGWGWGWRLMWDSKRYHLLTKIQQIELHLNCRHQMPAHDYFKVTCLSSSTIHTTHCDGSECTTFVGRNRIQSNRRGQHTTKQTK